jgi:hypothetical protein
MDEAPNSLLSLTQPQQSSASQDVANLQTQITNADVEITLPQRASFSGLPLEIRDMIYENLYDSTTTPVALPLSDKYKRSFKRESIFKEDHFNWNYYPKVPHFPVSLPALNRSTRMEIVDFRNRKANTRQKLVYKLDAVANSDGGWYPTWLSIQYPAEKIDVLEIRCRLPSYPADDDCIRWWDYQWGWGPKSYHIEMVALFGLIGKFMKCGPRFSEPLDKQIEVSEIKFRFGECYEDKETDFEWRELRLIYKIYKCCVFMDRQRKIGNWGQDWSAHTVRANPLEQAFLELPHAARLGVGMSVYRYGKLIWQYTRAQN